MRASENRSPLIDSQGDVLHKIKDANLFLFIRTSFSYYNFCNWDIEYPLIVHNKSSLRDSLIEWNFKKNSRFSNFTCSRHTACRLSNLQPFFLSLSTDIINFHLNVTSLTNNLIFKQLRSLTNWPPKNESIISLFIWNHVTFFLKKIINFDGWENSLLWGMIDMRVAQGFLSTIDKY